MFDLIKLISLITLIFAVNAGSFDKHKIVKTSNGQIRGILNTTLLNAIPFYSFKGIPYAKKPLGPLRFKPPEPANSWKPATLDAFEFGNICIQGQSPFLSTLSASEDCLTLNIFVPADIPFGCKLSVLIFIHGGLFKSGSGDDFMYGPDFIMEKQTILVTLNYRLGALGFLALGSKEISGNMGLKDQQLALKWIHSNIGGFGGDNKRITMIGQSVGGVSATYHVLSTESRKYIRRSIPISGSTGNVWAMAKEKNNLKLAYRMAKEIGGKKLNSYDELIDFFKKVPAEKLVPYNGDFSPNHDLVEIVFGPVVERRDADRPFLLEYPEKLYESTRIDTDTSFLFTICDVESLSVLPKRTQDFFAKLNANFSDHVRLPFRGFNIDYESDGYRNLANEIRQFYFGNKILDISLEYDYFKFTSDLNWVYVVDESVRNVSKILKGKTYYSWFGVDSKLNVWKTLKPPFPAEMAKYPGAGHGDDMCYLFKCGVAQERYDEVIRTKNDKQSQICLQTIEYITTLVTNMAKFGNPAYQNSPIAGFQPVVKNGEIPFLTITNGGLSLGINPRQRTIDFWNYIKQKALKLSCDERQNNQFCSN